MQSKSLLIAVAAFALTATGVHAYGGTKTLNRAGLSSQQISAIEEAQELRQSGNLIAARDKLVEAGVDEEALMAIRKAAHTVKSEMHKALESGDYEVFKIAIKDTPLADIITSEADFAQFREAHELRQEGEFAAARSLMTELGVEDKGWEAHRPSPHPRYISELNMEQREAFKVAKQANDRATMQAILDEAGVELRHPRKGW